MLDECLAQGFVGVCRFVPPPNDVLTEAGLTVLKVKLPTGVEPNLEDLRQVKLRPPRAVLA